MSHLLEVRILHNNSGSGWQQSGRFMEAAAWTEALWCNKVAVERLREHAGTDRE